MKRRFVPMAACGIGMLLLILDSRQAGASARDAIDLCIKSVIPSVFPFFLLSGFLTGGGVLFTGLFGGYPAGAQAAAQLAAGGYMDNTRASRLLTWCSQAGPSFIFGIAAAQFPDFCYGWYLWGVQILSALSVRMIFPEGNTVKNQYQKRADSSLAMHRALHAMGAVCGWVVIFRVILGFLERWFFFLLPDIAKVLLSGILELTNGCLMLPQIENIGLRFLLCLIFLNFGGVCVILQTISVAHELNIRYYLTGKLLQCGLAVLYGCLFLGYGYALFPLVGYFIGILFFRGRKNSSIPGLVGV